MEYFETSACTLETSGQVASKISKSLVLESVTTVLETPWALYITVSPLGISGIAIATNLSQFIGILYLYNKVLKTKIYIYFKYFYLIPNFQTIKNILSQGIPAAIGMLMIAIGSYIIIFFVGLRYCK